MTTTNERTDMDDRRGVEDALARFIFRLDRLEWDAFADTMTEDFRYGVKEPDGTRLVWFRGRDEMLRRIRPVAEGATVSQHFCPNALVEVDGTDATMLVNHIAYVAQPSKDGGEPTVWRVAGRWEAELRREDDGVWRFSGMVFDPTFLLPWQDDTRAFPPRGPFLGTPWDA